MVVAGPRFSSLAPLGAKEEARRRAQPGGGAGAGAALRLSEDLAAAINA